MITDSEITMPRVFLRFDGDMEGEPIINLGAGVKPTDAINKGQLDAKLDTAEKGNAYGIASLDGTGKELAGQLPMAVSPAIILSGTDHGVWIDLNSTSEQMRKVSHGGGAAPGEREVFFEPVADAGLDPTAVCLDFAKYLPTESNAVEMVFAIKLRTASGTAGHQGQLRVLTFAG